MAFITIGINTTINKIVIILQLNILVSHKINVVNVAAPTEMPAAIK